MTNPIKFDNAALQRNKQNHTWSYRRGISFYKFCYYYYLIDLLEIEDTMKALGIIENEGWENVMLLLIFII